MKLYFYICEYNKITFSEVEVEEKPKSYKLLDRVSGFYKTSILKSEIGFNYKYSWKQFVILTERDDELAKKYFSDYFKREIGKRQKEIDEFNNAIKIVSDWDG